MSYETQVDRSHYEGGSYRSPERWDSYWHQLELVRSVKPARVLEVGLGEGVVAWQLERGGIDVTTLDIAEDLKPDIVGSVTDVPLEDSSFDLVLAAEILEHIRFEDVPKALSEIARVTKRHVLITLPHPGYVFSLVWKIPLMRRSSIYLQLPFFWKTHQFNGEHYWELGKRGYPVRRFLDEAAKAGLKLTSYGKYADDPAHRSFLFEKRSV